MLTQLGPYRVHLILGAATLGWFSLATILGVADGDRRSALRRDRLELAAREESDGAAVG